MEGDFAKVPGHRGQKFPGPSSARDLAPSAAGDRFGKGVEVPEEAGGSFPSSPAVSLAQQVAASLIPGEDPAAGPIISSRQAAPRRKFSLCSTERQGRGDCHSAALEKTEG